MKKYLLPFVFGLGLISVASSCNDDDDDTGNNTAPGPSPLEMALSENYNLVSVYYNGTMTNPLSPGTPFPLNGNARDVSGYFNFTEAETVDYEAQATMDIEIPVVGQSIPLPYYDRGQGDIDIISETRFQVTNSTFGTGIYDVESMTENSLELSTSVEIDTLSFLIDMDVEFRLVKQP